jgi:hypothetical protein
VLIASSGIAAWIMVKKWTRYEFGLGQGRLGMKSGKRSILQKMLNLHPLMMLTSHIFSVFALENTPLKYENQCRICALSLVFFKPIIPQFPPLHYSSCERSELTCFMVLLH